MRQILLSLAVLAAGCFLALPGHALSPGDATWDAMIARVLQDSIGVSASEPAWDIADGRNGGSIILPEGVFVPLTLEPLAPEDVWKHLIQTADGRGGGSIIKPMDFLTADLPSVPVIWKPTMLNP